MLLPLFPRIWNANILNTCLALLASKQKQKTWLKHWVQRWKVQFSFSFSPFLFFLQTPVAQGPSSCLQFSRSRDQITAVKWRHLCVPRLLLAQSVTVLVGHSWLGHLSSYCYNKQFFFVGETSYKYTLDVLYDRIIVKSL